MTNENLNYDEEYASMKDGGDWFKATEGYYELTLMSELSKPTKKEVKFDNETKEVEQSEITVKRDGKIQKWSLIKGTSKLSVYAKLCFLGKMWKGLTGRTIHLTVEGSGKGKKVTIQEYAQLIQEQQKIIAK